MIRPCPFCALALDEEKAVREATLHCTVSAAWIQCPNCGAEGPAALLGGRDEEDVDIVQEALERWNHRP
jgi:hypothetical protein